MNPHETPIFIVLRDRMTSFRRLLDWLEGAGLVNIVIVDMDSTFPPLVEYLAQTRYRVLRPGNIGPHALWRSGLLQENLPSLDSRYVVTDEDVVPDDGCPKDVLVHLHRLLDEQERFGKIGLALRVDDIPREFPEYDRIVAWEERFWQNPATPELFDVGFGGVATTFALYRNLRVTNPNGDCYSGRTNYPYVARHLSWYLDPKNLSADERWYYEHAPKRRWGKYEPGTSWRPDEPAAPPPAGNEPPAPVYRPGKHKTNPLNLEKNQPYYQFVREEVIDLLAQMGIRPKDALELGCSSGATGKALKERLAIARYVGIEMFPDAAERARAVLDEVHQADIEKTSLESIGLQESSFDLLVALDVLEHLYNPWDVLADLARLLRPGGYAAFSIPNVQNITILLGLVEGRWSYESAGLLDATHIRFFTAAGINDLVSGAGLSVLQTNATLNPPINLATVKDTGNVFQQGKLRLADLTRDEVIQLFTYQFLVVAQRPR